MSRIVAGALALLVALTALAPSRAVGQNVLPGTGAFTAGTLIVLKPRVLAVGRAAALLTAIFADARVRGDAHSGVVVASVPAGRVQAFRYAFDALDTSGGAAGVQTFPLPAGDPARTVLALRRLFPAARIGMGANHLLVVAAAGQELAQIGIVLRTIAMPEDGPSVAPAGRPAVAHRATRAAVAAPNAVTLIGEDFTGTSTQPNAWKAVGGACLTAGNASTPATSIPACNGAAPQDAAGLGALQLTPSAQYADALVVNTTPLATANGLQVTWTDYSFNGTTPGADGMTVFLSDASKPLPATPGQKGGSLGYAGGTNLPGVPNAYLAVGLDEYGNFSSPTEGRLGGPGRIPETVAARGAAATGYQYLGGATNASGTPASLPFSFDHPTLTTRPAVAPTARFTLTAAGTLTLSIDRHDGNGFTTYYTQSIVGVGGQPAVPANVYVGMTASTAYYDERHQVGSFSVTALSSSNAPFTPAQIANLSSWFDAFDGSSITQQTGGAVSAWADKSGSGNTLAQSTTTARPIFTTAGINGAGSVSFGGSAFLSGANPSFSTSLFNESTVFVVANQANTTQQSSLLWSGAYYTNPRWNLRLSEGNTSNFDFNNKNEGRLSVVDVPTGSALWTAAGSFSGHTQLLRKNGNLLKTTTGPAAIAGGTYPLALGAMYSGGSVAYKYTGLVGEVVAYNRFLTAAESAEVEGYLACKWGLQGRLPANHPYRVTCPQGGTTSATPPPAPAGQLQSPPELRSAGGSLTLTMTAQQDPATGNPQLTYNGSPVPPTLRLLPGDTLYVNVTNTLPVPATGSAHMNNVSLHYHGLHVSPNAPGDDSIDMVAAPGQSLAYKVAIPANHPPGLYWYHSHAHGEAERQTLAAMSGALIIDGIAQYAPQVANLPERVLIVRDAPLPGGILPDANRLQANAMRWSMQHGAVMRPRPAAHTPGMSGTERHGRSTAATRNPFVLVDPQYRHVTRNLATDTHCTGPETAVKALTVNGQSVPAIGIRPGEQQFWRLVNAGADTYLDVQVDNAQMQIVALDGVPLAQGVNAPSSMTVSHYAVPPAGRIEFIVTGPAAGTTAAYLRTNCYDAGPAGAAMPATVLASIAGNSSPTDLAIRRRAVPQRAARVRPFAYRTARAIKALAVSRTQTVYYSDQNTINGVAYDPGAPPLFYAQSGTVEEWTIVNNSAQVHTFHIHQIHFVLEAINGATLAQQFLMDNVNVPAATTAGPGTVKVLLDFTDPLEIGTFLLHCHILSHEDGGMMAKIRVGTAPPLGVSSTNVTFASPSAAAQSVTVSGGQTPYSVIGCSGVASATVNGATVAIAAVAAGSCVLTVSDTTGLLANVAVTVQPPPPAVSLAPTSVSFTSVSAPAQNVSIAGGTTPYGANGCTGTATATIAGSSLTVAPQAAGSCTLTVTDAAGNTATLAVAVNAATTSSPADNLTFHQNAARWGWYQAETALTPTSVAATNFGLIASLTAPAGMPAFGKVYAQPLYVGNETLPDGTQHNLVIVATSTDQLYAFDDRTLAVVWHRDFTNPSAGVTQQSWTDTGCGDVNPDVGITGTPVIDRSLDRLYVVVPTKENGVFHVRLHAIALGTGLEALNAGQTQVGPTEVSGTIPLASGGTASIDPQWNFQRSALLEADGNVYVALGSHCDYGSSHTHGWMLGYSATTLAVTANIFDVTNQNVGTNYYLGAPWMSGFGPAADAQGNVYFATGNGPYNGTTNLSMSVVKVPGTLDASKASLFTPAGAAADSSADEDLGSGGVLLMPDAYGAYPHLLVAGGKCGAGGTSGTQGCQKYVLNRDALGGQQPGDAGALWHADAGGGMWGGPAFFRDAATYYIVYGNGLPISTYSLGTAPVTLNVVSSASPGCLECRNSGSQPIVSSNGTQSGTAVLWALKTPYSAGGSIVLEAFDPLNLGHQLFSGTAGTWTIGSGASYIGGALVSPVVANGRVYVPTDGAVAVFGLH